MSGRSKDQDLIDELAAWMQAPDAEAVQTNGHARATEPSELVADDVIIEDCRSAKNAPKFEALFDRGETSAYGADDSDADYALLGILKFETQDPDQLERLMRRSALVRPKWDEPRGAVVAALLDRQRPQGRARDPRPETPGKPEVVGQS